jgi:DNA-binding MarR family transcriptional regulator
MTTPASSAAAPPTAEEEACYRALMRATARISRAFDADLMRTHGMSLTDYGTLAFLSEAPGRQIRMSDLAALSDFSLSGMTRVVDRLAAQRLVRRERSADDGRSWNAVLTDEGLQRLRDAWPAHLASARRHVIDHFRGLDLPALTAAFDRFASGDQPRKPPPAEP